ncbi:MAG: protein-L-isoaspartate(D-aspartate) O-methyltransferase [Myxococcales bacterium]|nr:protein-L-isoaspartate(D-aspartate) O-methyltransferase [Myxococcales bacterium]
MSIRPQPAGSRDSTTQKRLDMVERTVVARGIDDPAVLQAMREVPRESFLPADLAEFAYIDAPLPIAEAQTISQPYIVALMAQALELQPGDRVLEIGSGSGYAAAILGRIASRVITLERHRALAEGAAEVLRRLGYDNVDVHHADGSHGWADAAPYDAIVVTAAPPEIPQPLLDQLAIGGRLVVPVGEEGEVQTLHRIRRTGPETLDEEDLGPVQFVPFLAGLGKRAATVSAPAKAVTLPERIAAEAEAFDAVDSADIEALIERIGPARLVLIGEASHGTLEFYRMRQRVSRELIERHGFSFVAAEADWPDAAAIDAYVRAGPGAPERPREIFGRFPSWMWRNAEVLEFVDWLREHNDSTDAPAGFYGLDLYSLYESITGVLDYLDDVDPHAARIARQRYGCLSPFESDPASYGLAALSQRYEECEADVLAMLDDLRARRGEYVTGAGERFLDAEQNARVAVNAERYYRAMYYGGAESWNLRDRHMFETLEALMAFHGPDAKGIVWAHNSHLGDARHTEFAARGELNVGQLVKERFGDQARAIGFGTHSGTVAAAPTWGAEMEVMDVRPSLADSHERLCHDPGVSAFVLPLRVEHVRDAELHRELSESRLQRAIGVVYRPETERASHYFAARVSPQFDEYIWFDETTATAPLVAGEQAPMLAEGHPFATIDV